MYVDFIITCLFIHYCKTKCKISDKDKVFLCALLKWNKLDYNSDFTCVVMEIVKLVVSNCEIVAKVNVLCCSYNASSYIVFYIQAPCSDLIKTLCYVDI